MKKIGLFILIFEIILSASLYSLPNNATVKWQLLNDEPVLYSLEEALYETARFRFVDTSADYVFRVGIIGGRLNLRVYNEKTGVMVRIYNFTLNKNYDLDNIVASITTDFARKRKKILKIYADRIIVEKGRDTFYPGQLWQLSVVEDEIADGSGRALGMLYRVEGIYSIENIYDNFLVLKPLWQGKYKPKIGDYIKVR